MLWSSLNYYFPFFVCIRCWPHIIINLFYIWILCFHSPFLTVTPDHCHRLHPIRSQGSVKSRCLRMPQLTCTNVRRHLYPLSPLEMNLPLWTLSSAFYFFIFLFWLIFSGELHKFQSLAQKLNSEKLFFFKFFF